MPEWNKLPAEVQEMIVQLSNKNTRNSLRACSKNSKLLVEGTKLKKCQYHLHSQSFANFEELQVNLMKILKSIGCIENLIISLPISTPPIKLINNKNRSRLLVEWVVIKGDGNSQQENILSQLEPAYLSTIVLKSDAQNSRIYDMEQVIHAETLKVYGRSCIREEQLLKLNADHVIFQEVTCSIRNYVDQCALKAGKRMQIFQFGATSYLDLSKLDIANSELFFKISYKKCKGERSHGVYAVVGSSQYDNDSNKPNFWRCDRSLLRILPSLRISYRSEDRSWIITVKSLSYCREKYRFQEFQEFQEKIDEIMESVDFIKDFSIKLTGSNEEIRWNRKNDKLMVKKLSIEGDNERFTVLKLLELIDPNFPIDVTTVRSRSISSAVLYYHMPQIRNASRVRIANPNFSDALLLSMNHFYFSIAEGSSEEQHCSPFLTPARITQFLKKCVRSVGKKPINFNLGRLLILKKKTAEHELFNFEGLNIIKTIRYQDKEQFVINCDHSDYVMNFIVSSRLDISGFVSHRDETHPCYPF